MASNRQVLWFEVNEIYDTVTIHPCILADYLDGVYSAFFVNYKPYISEKIAYIQATASFTDDALSYATIV